MITDAQDALVTSLSNCAAFQALVSADDAAEALSRIYEDALPEPTGHTHTKESRVALRPCAMVFTADDQTGWSYQRNATGCWHASGALIVTIERNVGDELPSAADRIMRQLAGNIAQQLAEQAETAGRIALQRIEIDGPFRVAEEDLEAQGDFQWINLRCTWGTDR